MLSLKVSASSGESMAGAMAAAVAQAENISADAAQINITPLSYIEDDGEYRVMVIVDIVEEADLDEDQLKQIEARKSFFNKETDEDLSEEFDEEASALIVTNIIDQESDLADVVPNANVDRETPVIGQEAPKEEIKSSELDQPVTELLAGPEWEDQLIEETASAAVAADATETPAPTPSNDPNGTDFDEKEEPDEGKDKKRETELAQQQNQEDLTAKPEPKIA